MRIPAWLLLTAIALAVAVLAALGSWQIVRHFEKNDLEAALLGRSEGTQLAAAAALALAPEEVNFHRVELTGVWDHANTMIVANRVRFGSLGEDVVTPLLLDDGAAVLVNRGWYPLSEHEATLRALGGEQRAVVSGIARYAPGGSTARTVEGAWRVFNVDAIGGTLPYPVEPWGLLAGERIDGVELLRSDALPVTGWRAYEDSVPHLGYALTWWGLAAGLLATAVIRLRPFRGGVRGSDAAAGRV